MSIELAVGVEAGVVLARWFAAESTRIYAMLAESEEQRETRRLIEFIRSKAGMITVRQLQRSNSNKYHSPDVGFVLEGSVNDGLETGGS